jgi:hypothetical protein
LGFREKRRVGTGTEVRITKSKVGDMCLRMGLIEGAKELSVEEVPLTIEQKEREWLRKIDSYLYEVIDDLTDEVGRVYEMDIVVDMRENKKVPDEATLSLIKKHLSNGDLKEISPRNYAIVKIWQ